MGKVCAVLYLIAVSSLTFIAFSQPLSTIDTVQNMEIARTQDEVVAVEKRVDNLAASVVQLSATIERGTGIVIGIGCTLTLLQIVSMVLARKKT